MWNKQMTTHIATVAKAFDIPASTLRYWESLGLFSTNREKNNYREFSYASLLDISDVIYLRRLGIPIQDIKQFRKMSLLDTDGVYKKKKQALEEQFQRLRETYSVLCQTLSLMGELEEIRRNTFRESWPDVSLILTHERLYSPETWKRYFSGVYGFAGCRSAGIKGTWAWGWAADHAGPDDRILWKLSGNERHFLQFVLRIRTDCRTCSNLEEVFACLQTRGYQIGEVITRYVTIAYEDDARWDYYKAWVEVW